LAPKRMETLLTESMMLISLLLRFDWELRQEAII
jgi:hypothetical protein